MYNEDKLKLIYLARETEDYELVKPSFGSFSCLCAAKDHILIAPQGENRFSLRPDDIIIVDRSGREIENINGHKIPDDLDLHLVSYDVRDSSIDVVMHINPKNASLRADEGNRIIFLSDCINPQDSPDGDIAKLIEKPIVHRDYMLIKNNGVLIVGQGVFETLEKAKYIENIAKIKMPKDEIHDFEFIEKEPVRKD